MTKTVYFCRFFSQMPFSLYYWSINTRVGEYWAVKIPPGCSGSEEPWPCPKSQTSRIGTTRAHCMTPQSEGHPFTHAGTQGQQGMKDYTKKTGKIYPRGKHHVPLEQMARAGWGNTSTEGMFKTRSDNHNRAKIPPILAFWGFFFLPTLKCGLSHLLHDLRGARYGPLGTSRVFGQPPLT